MPETFAHIAGIEDALTCPTMWTRLRSLWAAHHGAALWVMAALTITAAGWRISNEGGKFIRMEKYSGRDLYLRDIEVQSWFAGDRAYELHRHAVYPPAAYLQLWLLTGWVEGAAERWWWAATAIVAAVAMGLVLVRITHAKGASQRLLVGFAPIASYAAAMTVYTGQLPIHMLAAVIGAFTLASRPNRGWATDAAIAVLFVIGVTKPSLTAPLFWVLLTMRGGLRPAILTAVLYGLTSVAAAAFQQQPLWELMIDWTAQAQRGTNKTSQAGGYGDIHSLLAWMGMRQWGGPLTYAVIVALGAWICWRRRAEMWVLVGIAALVTRLCAAHRIYDDMITVLPMIGLWRLAAGGPIERSRDVKAGVLLIALWAASLTPVTLFYASPLSRTVFQVGQLMLWLIVLVFMVRVAADQSRAATRSLDHVEPSMRGG